MNAGRSGILECHFPAPIAEVLLGASSGLNAVRWAECFKALVADKDSLTAAIQTAISKDACHIDDLGDGSGNCAIESAPALTVQDSQRLATELLQQKYGRS